MKRTLLILMLFSSTVTMAQFPRNTDDRFELAQDITVNAPDSVLQQRARSFYKEPFIIHWDSVAYLDQTNVGKGYINLRVNYRLKSFMVSVTLLLEITVKPNGYHYSLHEMRASRKNSMYNFPLEKKPDDVNIVPYDQLLTKSYTYLSATVSLLKRYMAGEWIKPKK